eukprot:PhM_4_TR17068/c0_g1_i2/m.30841/K03327/TC.MATE, SLC47A, norM, mdtK, dinF; multidrug resistance protein, MATE family
MDIAHCTIPRRHPPPPTSPPLLYAIPSLLPPPQTETLLPRSTGTSQYNTFCSTATTTEEIDGGTTLLADDVLTSSMFERSFLGPFFLNFVATAGASIMYFLNNTATMVFIGQRLTTHELAVFSTVTAFIVSLGLGPTLGCGQAVDTLVSQAYGRQPKCREIGILAQRAIFVNTVLWFMCALIFIFVCPIVLPHVLPHAMTEATLWLLVMSCPQVWLQGANACLEHTLTAQQTPHLNLPVYTIGTIISVAANYVFITPSMGLLGVVVSQTLAFFALFLCLLACCIWLPESSVPHAPFLAWREILKPDDLWEFTTLAVAAATALCADWWSFEVLLLFASRYGPVELAAYSIAMNVVNLCWAVPEGIADASSAVVGNALGSNQPNRARRYFRFAVGVSVLSSSVLACVVFFARHLWVTWYTDDTDVAEALRHLVVPMCAILVLDNLRTTMLGVFVGAGRQSTSAAVTCFTGWVVAVPLSIAIAKYALNDRFLRFVTDGRESKLLPALLQLDGAPAGLMLGASIGCLCAVPILMTVAVRWDWVAMAQQISREDAECVMNADQQCSCDGGNIATLVTRNIVIV